MRDFWNFSCIITASNVIIHRELQLSGMHIKESFFFSFPNSFTSRFHIKIKTISGNFRFQPIKTSFDGFDQNTKKQVP
jgi:hypothetical protein